MKTTTTTDKRTCGTLRGLAMEAETACDWGLAADFWKQALAAYPSSQCGQLVDADKRNIRQHIADCESSAMDRWASEGGDETQRKLSAARINAAHADAKVVEYRTAYNSYAEWNARKRDAAENLDWWIGKAAALEITIKNLEQDAADDAEFKTAWLPLLR